MNKLLASLTGAFVATSFAATTTADTLTIGTRNETTSILAYPVITHTHYM